jgi:drug/metabolite transporter (DMT)-like permease
VPDRKRYIVDALLLTVVTIWGFNFAVMKLMYRYFHPFAFNGVRFMISSAAMVIALKIRGEKLEIDRRDLPAILWLGFLSNTLYQFVFVVGLERTRAGNAALLMALSPVFAYLIGVVLKREKFVPGVLGGVILSLVGVATIVLFGSGGVSLGSLFETWGDLLMIVAAAVWALQSVQSIRLLPKYGALRLTVSTMIAGTALMVPLSIPWLTIQDWSGIAPMAWVGLGYSALLSIAYSYLVWAYALRRIGIAHTAVFNNLTPIVALIAGWFLLAERPSAAQLSGVVLVLAGVYKVRSRKPLATPDE